MRLKYYLYLFLFLSSSLFAEVDQKWKFALGGLRVFDFETELQVTPSGSPARPPVNLEKDFGLDYDSVMFYAGGHYRFDDFHRIAFTYYGVRSEGTARVQRDIPWQGELIPSGSLVTINFDGDIYKLVYGYSFYHDKSLELTLSAGLHMTVMDLKVDVDSSHSADDESFKTDNNYPMPKPIIGFDARYEIIERKLSVLYLIEYFDLDLDNADAYYLNQGIALEYKVNKAVGVGVGYIYNVFDAKVEDKNKKIDIENKFSGTTFYLTYSF